MKNVFLLFTLSIFLLGCPGTSKKVTEFAVTTIDSNSFLTDSTIAQIPEIEVRIDTIYIRQNNDSLLNIIKNLRLEQNELKDELFVSNYRIERAKYYLKIVKRNPSQLKFLVSWMNRALD